MKWKIILTFLLICVSIVSAGEFSFVDAPYTCSNNGYNYVFTNDTYFRLEDNDILNSTFNSMGENINCASDGSEVYTVSLTESDEDLSIKGFELTDLILNQSFSGLDAVYPEISADDDLDIAFFGGERVKYMEVSREGSLITNTSLLPGNKSELFSGYSVKEFNLSKDETRSFDLQAKNMTKIRLRLFDYNGEINISSSENYSTTEEPLGFTVSDFNEKNVNFSVQALDENETIRMEISSVPEEKTILLPYSSEDLDIYDSLPKLKVLNQSDYFEFSFSPVLYPENNQLNVSASMNISLPHSMESSTINLSEEDTFQGSINTTNQSGINRGYIQLRANNLTSKQDLILFVDSRKPVIEDIDVQMDEELFVNVSVDDDSLNSLSADDLISYEYSLLKEGELVSESTSFNNTFQYSGLTGGDYNVTVRVFDKSGKASSMESEEFELQEAISISDVTCNEEGLEIAVRNEGNELIGKQEITIYRVSGDNRQTIGKNYIEEVPVDETVPIKTGAPCENSLIRASYAGSFDEFNYTGEVSCSADIEFNGCYFNESKEKYLADLSADWRGGYKGVFRWDPTGNYNQGGSNWQTNGSRDSSFDMVIDGEVPVNKIFFDILNSDGGSECRSVENLTFNCLEDSRRRFNKSFEVSDARNEFSSSHLFLNDIFEERLPERSITTIMNETEKSLEYFSGNISVENNNVTNLSTRFVYDGQARDYILLIQDIPKSFESNYSNIDVQTSGRVEVIEEDPKYAIIFENVEPEDNLVVEYNANDLRDISPSDIDDPYVFVYDESFSYQSESDDTTTTTTSKTTSTTISTTTSTTTSSTTTTNTNTTIPQEPTTTTSSASTPSPEPEGGGGFPLVLIIILVVLVVLGVFVFMFKERIMIFIKYITA